MLSSLLQNPTEYLPAFEQALQDLVPRFTDLLKLGQDKKNYKIGIEGIYGPNNLTPRQVCSAYIGKLISIEGIVTRCNVIFDRV